MFNPRQFYADLAYDPKFSSYIDQQYFDPYRIDLYGQNKRLQDRNFFDLMDYRGYPGSKNLELAASTRLKDNVYPIRSSIPYNKLQESEKAFREGGSVNWFADTLDSMGIKIKPNHIGVGLNFAGYLNSIDNRDTFGRALATGNLLADSAASLGFKVPQGAYGALGLAHLGSTIPNLLENWDDMDELEKGFALQGIYQGFGNLNRLSLGQTVSDFQRYTPDFMTPLFSRGGRGVEYLNKQLSSVGDEFYNLAEPYLPESIKTENPTMFGPTGQIVSSGAGLGLGGANIARNWNEMNSGERAVSTMALANDANNLYKGVGALKAAGSTAASSSASTATGSIPGLETIGKVLPFAAAALGGYNMLKGWGKGGNAESRRSQAANAASIGSMFGPWGMAIGALAGLGIGSIKTGRSTEEMKRDSYRRALTGDKKPFVSSDEIDVNDPNVKFVGDRKPWQKGMQLIQLADGSYVPISMEGDDSFINKKAMREELMKGNKYYNPNRGLRAYDVDYTSDLDYMTSLAANALNMGLFGGSIDTRTKSEQAQIAGLYTNAWTSNLPGREFTKENFEKVMANARATYQKAGVNSREDLLKYADELKKQGKLSDDDYNQFLIAGDFVFSDSSAYDRAQALNKALGREDGGSAVSGVDENGKSITRPSMTTEGKPTMEVDAPQKTAKDKTFEMIGQVATAEDISKAVSSDKKKQEAIKKEIDQLVSVKASPEEIANKVQELANE